MLPVVYHKVFIFSDPTYLTVNILKFKLFLKRIYDGMILRKDANRIANSEDPDQTAPRGAV